MATFVVVHGAWCGAHAWRWMRPLLRAAGHNVFTPCPTGLGERAHLATSEADLETHVQDVAAVLHDEDLREVVPVGHSHGGMVITGVAARAGDRADISSTSMPRFRSTGRASSTSPHLTSARRTRRRNGHAATDGGSPALPQPLSRGTDPTVVWAVARMVPQPRATFTQRTSTSGPAEEAAPVARTYLLCTQGKEGQATPPYVDRTAADPAWRLVRLRADHAARVTAPSALTATLVQLVVN